jgi:hypothetical protein
MAKDQNENTDLLGCKWILAPNGRDRVYKCQAQTWELHLEVLGYASLFRNMQGCELTDEELYGISLSLERISKRLGKLSEVISRSIIKEQ